MLRSVKSRIGLALYRLAVTVEPRILAVAYETVRLDVIAQIESAYQQQMAGRAAQQ